MDNQDKIFEKIKNAAHKAEEKDFPGMDRIWQRVDAKLEQKELQTKSKTWKKMAVAASLLLIFSIGYQFFKTDSKIITPNETKANSVVVQEKQDTAIIEKPSENIKPDAATILKKQIEKQTPLVVAEKNNSEKNNIAEEVAMTETKDIMIRGAAEAQKSEAIILEENNANSKGLNEAVVIGYGTQKRKSKASAFQNKIFEATEVKSAYAKSEQLDSIRSKKAAVASAPLVVVNGKVTDTDYRSVKEAKRKIPYQLGDEELESLTVLKEPLYIINGVEYTEESLFGTHPTSPYAPLNKQNIEKMEVFQDKEAVAKFGKKGSKGVVIITTKNRMPSQK